MKRISFILVSCAIALSSIAQLKVADNGNVGIQIGTITPLSSFCVNTAGDTNT